MFKKYFITIILCLLLTACGTSAASNTQTAEITGSMQLLYADKFSVEYCADGCSVIHTANEDFLLVPENTPVPVYGENMYIIRQPVKNIYLAATSAMDLFDALDALDSISMTSTDTDGWSLPNVQNALESGKMRYIGKYSAPDYEILAQSDCALAIESTMINHSPETKEQIQALGIPVFTEQSSYESHPLARLEWIKLYALLLGREKEGEEYFNKKNEAFTASLAENIPENMRKSAAFFYVSPNGYVNIRKPGDYVSKMIELAGGKYVFTADKLKIEENALSTMNIQLEEFYETAKDADVLIYNSTIEGGLENLSDLVAINPVFEDFRAVKNGNVWCTEKNMFQQTTGAADTVSDLHKIFTGEADDTDQLTFLHRLK